MRFLTLTAAASLCLTAALVVHGQVDPARIGELLSRLDANGDDLIEPREVPEAQRAQFERMLKFGDANHDGKLQAAERQTILERARAKAQGQAPAQQTQQISQMLRQMDRNGDGKVSREEFTSYPDYFERLDANKDGVLVAEEVRPPFGFYLNPNNPHVPAPRESTGLIPLPDLKTGKYKSKEGGLYPGGRNERPAAHEQAGLRLARAVRPLDRDGKPASDGKIVLLSIGMSNTTQEFSRFKELADQDQDRNPRLVIVDGAQGGMTAKVISQPDTPRGKQFWETVDQRLEQAGVSRAQVQAAWLKEADAMPAALEFPVYALDLELELEQILHILVSRFPKLRLCYNSSRIYGGYAITPLNPEPFAYESGFSVKWLIENQIVGAPELNFDPAHGPVKAPWLAWGPYLWTDGTKGRSDGLTFVQSDLVGDGTHPSPSGRQKVARLLLDFMRSDSTTRPWFLARGSNRSD